MNQNRIKTFQLNKNNIDKLNKSLSRSKITSKSPSPYKSPIKSINRYALETSNSQIKVSPNKNPVRINLKYFLNRRKIIGLPLSKEAVDEINIKTNLLNSNNNDNDNNISVNNISDNSINNDKDYKNTMNTDTKNNNSILSNSKILSNTKKSFKQKLKRIFTYYCQYGEKLNTTNLKSAGFYKLCQEAGLVNDRITKTRIELIFSTALLDIKKQEENLFKKKMASGNMQVYKNSSSIKLGPKSIIDFDGFLNCLMKIAEIEVNYKLELLDKNNTDDNEDNYSNDVNKNKKNSNENNISLSADLKSSVNIAQLIFNYLDEKFLHLYDKIVNNSNNINATINNNTIASNTNYKSVVTLKYDLNLNKETMTIIEIAFPFIKEFYSIYFKSELSLSENGEYIKQNSIKNLFEFLKDYDISPGLLSKPLCYDIFNFFIDSFNIKEIIEFLNEKLGTALLKDSVLFGKYLTIYHFIIIIIAIANNCFDFTNDNNILTNIDDNDNTNTEDNNKGKDNSIDFNNIDSKNMNQEIVRLSKLTDNNVSKVLTKNSRNNFTDLFKNKSNHNIASKEVKSKAPQLNSYNFSLAEKLCLLFEKMQLSEGFAFLNHNCSKSFSKQIISMDQLKRIYENNNNFKFSILQFPLDDSNNFNMNNSTINFENSGIYNTFNNNMNKSLLFKGGNTSVYQKKSIKSNNKDIFLYLDIKSKEVSNRFIDVVSVVGKELKIIFDYYCEFGDNTNPGIMSNFKFTKFLRDSGLIVINSNGKSDKNYKKNQNNEKQSNDNKKEENKDNGDLNYGIPLTEVDLVFMKLSTLDNSLISLQFNNYMSNSNSNNSNINISKNSLSPNTKSLNDFAKAMKLNYSTHYDSVFNMNYKNQFPQKRNMVTSIKSFNIKYNNKGNKSENFNNKSNIDKTLNPNLDRSNVKTLTMNRSINRSINNNNNNKSRDNNNNNNSVILNFFPYENYFNSLSNNHALNNNNPNHPYFSFKNQYQKKSNSHSILTLEQFTIAIEVLTNLIQYHYLNRSLENIESFFIDDLKKIFSEKIKPVFMSIKNNTRKLTIGKIKITENDEEGELSVILLKKFDNEFALLMKNMPELLWGIFQYYINKESLYSFNKTTVSFKNKKAIEKLRMSFPGFFEFITDFEIFPSLISKTKLITFYKLYSEYYSKNIYNNENSFNNNNNNNNSSINNISVINNNSNRNDSLIDIFCFCDIIAQCSFELLFNDPQPAPHFKTINLLEKMNFSEGCDKLFKQTGLTRLKNGEVINLVSPLKQLFPEYYEENNRIEFNSSMNTRVKRNKNKSISMDFDKMISNII